ncbi:MAG: hypothetical protein KJ952_06405 [Candidatus Omnitrophica bacterium]|nr:hypothetical protein [Candidatus Omnitrophota bacterium]
MLKFVKHTIIIILIGSVLFFGIKFYSKYLYENNILKEVVSRLQADSRIAEVLVTGVNYDENIGKTRTTIKFLEYDVNSNPLEPRYFTFLGNILQFQCLVIRFDDIHIRSADKLRGKSAYIFWKVFMLDGPDTEEYEINKMNEVPKGYKLQTEKGSFEKELWRDFWKYALDSKERSKSGIKNAQIEAPGTMFIPGMLYTIKIEHDGGIRIDTSKLPAILKGEKILE